MEKLYVCFAIILSACCYPPLVGQKAALAAIHPRWAHWYSFEVGDQILRIILAALLAPKVL